MRPISFAIDHAKDGSSVNRRQIVEDGDDDEDDDDEDDDDEDVDDLDDDDGGIFDARRVGVERQFDV